jgi:hypothetical protein
MKFFAFAAAAALLALLGFRLHDVGFRFGDLVAWWVLAVTLGLEALIVIGGAIEWRNDPRVQQVAQQRALLEMASADKRAGRRQVQQRPI